MLGFFNDDGSKEADLYVDLGTENTLIAAKGKGIILNEPSIIACIESRPGKRKIIAIGDEARQKAKDSPGNISTIRPLRNGVIADIDTAETMLRYFIKRCGAGGFFNKPILLLSLPYGVTEVEQRAAIQAGKAAGAKDVILIDEPMAAAIGAELPVQEARGSMIIDLGGGTTEIAIIALADIVYCETVRIGGHKLDEAILNYLKEVKKINISETLAESLKRELGTACPRKDIRFKTITGRDSETGILKEIELSSEDIGNALDVPLGTIINAIHQAISNTLPELVGDLIETGIVLTGGGALIRDLDVRIRNEVRLPVRVSDDPLIAIAKGGEKILSNPDLLMKVQVDA